MKKSRYSLITLLLLIVISVPFNAQDKIYYTLSDAGNTIYNVSRANIDGSSTEIIIADDGSQDPSGIALDLTNNKVYFTDTGNQKIRKCDLDGSNPADLITNVRAEDIALDIDGGKMYYTVSDAGNVIYNVSRANIDGSGAEIIIADDGSQDPSGIALDLTNNKIYFTDTGNQKIRKCDLDGSNPTDLITNVRAEDIALDIDGGKMYYTVSDAGNVIYNVSRANIDGSGAEIIIADDGSQDPSGIALDLTNNKVYFTDTGNQKIRKCDLDGSNPTDLVTNVRVEDIVGTNTSPPLPVELTSFYADLNDDGVLLSWETATEINNYGFEIERSDSANSVWQSIGFVNGFGTSNSPKFYSYLDENTPNTIEVSYRLKQIDIDGSYNYSKVIMVNLSDITSSGDNKIKFQFALDQNYPNPFNPSTTIKYSIPNSGVVKLNVYNLLGQSIAQLVNDYKQAGEYSIQFNASELPSGSYIYKLRVDNFTDTKKMLLVK